MRRVGIAIVMISAASIGYEILLMRLLSIIQWHHFAFMIISLALLGYGASGTFVTLTQRWLLARFHGTFAVSAGLFSLTVVTSFIVVQRIPFNPLEILWDRNQIVYLMAVYLVLSLPFFFGAVCIGLALTRFKAQIHRLYRLDLVGAGLGALALVLLLFVTHPIHCLRFLGAFGFLSAGIVCLERAGLSAKKFAVACFIMGLICPMAWPEKWLAPRISQYKGLTYALQAPDAQIVDQRFSPLGWLAVVRSPVIPFRHAPGLSLNCRNEPPQQLGVFTDGDAFTPINKYQGNRADLAYLDCLTSALPYHIMNRPETLVLGAGGAADVHMALYYGSKSVDAVELNPQMVELVEEAYGGFTGHPYRHEGVAVHVEEARGFISKTAKRYDLIHVSLMDAYSTAAAGGHALHESYVYTVEALQAYHGRLRSQGILAVTRWLSVPPRDTLKLFATAVAALEKSGVDRPELQLAMIRSLRTSTLLIKNGLFTREETRRIRSFCDERFFDVAYYPGMSADEANRHNRLDEPYLYDGATALLGAGRNDYMRRYKFYIAPATDDRPYFFHFFKWRTLPEIVALRGQGGLPLMEWTYPFLAATLAQALTVSIVLILVPIGILRRSARSMPPRIRLAIYFVSLGFGFLFIEIAFIQKFILFLSHPVYAMAVVLCAFLVFAGLGSGFSDRWARYQKSMFPRWGDKPIIGAVLGIVLTALLYAFLLPPVFRQLMGLSTFLKVILTTALVAPLAFFMGMPFPLGLSKVAESVPNYTPWAWGLNGFSSVISAIMAIILAIHLGFTAVVIIAILLYLLAALAFPDL